MKNKYTLMIIGLLVTTILCASNTGCSNSLDAPAQSNPVTLNISVAASLTDAIKEINSLYKAKHPNVTINANFASSGTLQKQIEQGAPADLFLSAGASQMDALAQENLIDLGTRKNLVINTLVMVVPTDSSLDLTSLNDLATQKVKKLAIGDPASVPAGKYAQQAFDQLGITAVVTPKYVVGADVRAVLGYVESGNVDAGLVYLTDAKLTDKVKIVADAPREINAKIVYPVAVVSATRITDEARRYQVFLFDAESRAVFEKFGFTMATK